MACTEEPESTVGWPRYVIIAAGHFPQFRHFSRQEKRERWKNFDLSLLFSSTFFFQKTKRISQALLCRIGLCPTTSCKCRIAPRWTPKTVAEQATKTKKEPFPVRYIWECSKILLWLSLIPFFKSDTSLFSGYALKFPNLTFAWTFDLFRMVTWYHWWHKQHIKRVLETSAPIFFSHGQPSGKAKLSSWIP